MLPHLIQSQGGFRITPQQKERRGLARANGEIYSGSPRTLMALCARFAFHDEKAVKLCRMYFLPLLRLLLRAWVLNCRFAPGICKANTKEERTEFSAATVAAVTEFCHNRMTLRRRRRLPLSCLGFLEVEVFPPLCQGVHLVLCCSLACHRP